MIHDAALVSALGPLVGGRIYAVTFPQQQLPEWPAIRFTPAGGAITPDACGSGAEETDDIRVQIDCVAETYEAAEALCSAVRAAMDAFTPPAVADAHPLRDWDPETKTFRVIIDFTIYGSSTS